MIFSRMECLEWVDRKKENPEQYGNTGFRQRQFALIVWHE